MQAKKTFLTAVLDEWFLWSKTLSSDPCKDLSLFTSPQTTRQAVRQVQPELAALNVEAETCIDERLQELSLSAQTSDAGALSGTPSAEADFDQVMSVASSKQCTHIPVTPLLMFLVFARDLLNRHEIENERGRVCALVL